MHVNGLKDRRLAAQTGTNSKYYRRVPGAFMLERTVSHSVFQGASRSRRQNCNVETSGKGRGQRAATSKENVSVRNRRFTAGRNKRRRDGTGHREHKAPPQFLKGLSGPRSATRVSQLNEPRHFGGSADPLCDFMASVATR